MTVDIEVFDPGSAPEADLRAYHEVVLTSRAVDRPDEPVVTYEQMVGRLRAPFAGSGVMRHWVARRVGRVVGTAAVSFPDTENAHLATTEITVHAGHRRRGVGTALLRAVVPAAADEGRTLLEAWGVVRDGAGARWAQQAGFRRVHANVMQILVVAGVDRGLWQVGAPPGYRAERWVGRAPEQLLESYAHARTAISDAPKGEAGFRVRAWTPRRVREAEAEARDRGIEQWVVAAVHEATGTVAGLTELELHSHRGDRAYQGETAVLAEHRGNDLGRYVKSRLMRWVTAERPGLAEVVTGVAEDNVHMVRVNHRIGFVTAQITDVVAARIPDLRHRLAPTG